MEWNQKIVASFLFSAIPKTDAPLPGKALERKEEGARSFRDPSFPGSRRRASFGLASQEHAVARTSGFLRFSLFYECQTLPFPRSEPPMSD
jgi:hypothetical protein